MNVEEFKTKNQEKISWVLVLVKDLWTWTIVTKKAINFANYELKTLFIKSFWWEKNWNDVNWLSTFKIL
jgi:hypothetical protein